MKVRAIVAIDYEIPGGFKEVGEEETKLENAIQSFVENNPWAVLYEVDIKERRGDNPPNIKGRKFRTN